MSKQIARCSIYEDRPQMCKDYPTIYHWMPPECTYTFPAGEGGKREGSCNCKIAACCSVPREHGEPGGAPLPEEAGGEPCKYIVWVDEEEVKEAAEEVQADGSLYGVIAINKLLGV